MSFWGIQIQHPNTKVDLEEDINVHLSTASLGPTAKDGDKVFIQATVGEENFILGSLTHGKNDSLSFDLFFDTAVAPVALSTLGSNTPVYFTGYQGGDDEGEGGFDFDDDEDLSDLEGLEDEDEDEEEDEAPQLIKPSPKIKEITDAEEKKIRAQQAAKQGNKAAPEKKEREPQAAPKPQQPQQPKPKAKPTGDEFIDEHLNEIMNNMNSFVMTPIDDPNYMYEKKKLEDQGKSKYAGSVAANTFDDSSWDNGNNNNYNNSGGGGNHDELAGLLLNVDLGGDGFDFDSALAGFAKFQ